jgi:hypothetical protein
MGSVEKRFGWGSILGYLAMGVPVAGGGYFVYQKHRSMADATVAETRAVAPAEPAEPTTVAVAPSFADPETLKRKQEADEQLRRERAAATRPAEADQQAATPDLGRKTKSKVLTLGPSAVREVAPEPSYSDPTPSPQASARTGAQVYQSEVDENDRRRREEGNLRQKGYRTEYAAPQRPLLPFNGSSSYGSSSSRSTSSARK